MSSFLDSVNSSLSAAISSTNTPAQVSNNSVQGGFGAVPVPAADGNGLPSQKVQSMRTGNNTRSLMHWFVPEFGVVKMYCNPESITYTHKKLIKQEKTKGGFTLQYWGEALSTLQLSGTTGSSGIEGINVLYEIYRAEQYAFDAIGLTLAADNAASDAANQIVGGVGNLIGSAISGGSSVGATNGSYIASSLFGTDPSSQALAAQNIPSLAQYAFGVEVFYLGWVYRGYFEDMTVHEKSNPLGLFDYSINFVVTERRGYRVNNLPWQKSAINGPSGEGVPYSFNNIKI